MRAIDATQCPMMAAPHTPGLAGFGSVAEFGRMLDAVLDGVRDRAARQSTAGCAEYVRT
ncbi:hypothetical protein LTT66_30720 [Nocardia gipuzkoensis]|uniref:hypothetical protein n=1 Tax=Nocardia gipuzkoensis TaxID=2749991 RepID=UPI001E5B4FE4|nr:hypothetical protein [Nocardia gipuzkoensis]UGT67541.1 hypothetical protein LTT66_30720 [Nocardia gipuzkoensis]